MSLKLLELSPSELSPNSWNSNEVGAENELKIEKSISEFGIFKPILARETDDGYEIIGGQHRWQIAKRMGYKTVPVINLGPISDEAAKKIGLVDNARYGDDDPLRLSEILNSLGNLGEIKEIIPFSDDDLSAIFASSSIALNDLDLLDSGVNSSTPAPQDIKPAQTHQVMRFKVPVADVAWLTLLIEKVIREKAYREKDSLMNAGSALIDIANASKDLV
jgi:ParB family chromosome partitioning protein